MIGSRVVLLRSNDLNSEIFTASQIAYRRKSFKITFRL